jgi:hypothetical protein
MKKILGLFIGLMFIFQISAISQFNLNPQINDSRVESTDFSQQIVDMINQVNHSLVSSYLEDIVSFGPRNPGSEGCDNAAKYLFNMFESFGLDVYFDDFKFYLINKTEDDKKELLEFKTKNVIATHNGINPSSDAIYILCAHYDTVDCTVGANDDGSGIATMLTVANIMSKYSFNHTVCFIAFSGHELGTWGSHHYVKQAYNDTENIAGVIMLDMIGNTTKQGNIIQMTSTYRTQWMVDFIHTVSETYKDNVNIVVEQIPNYGGDCQSFLDYGYDALTFIQSNPWEPPCHKPEDDLDHIVFPFLVNVTKLILAITAELAQKPIIVQVQIVTPYEGSFYFLDHAFILPRYNLWTYGIRGMTYLFGNTTMRYNITSEDEINAIYLSLDYNVKYYCSYQDFPDELVINKTTIGTFPTIHLPLTGTHTLGITVTTFSGKTAYDEMDIFAIFPYLWYREKKQK